MYTLETSSALGTSSNGSLPSGAATLATVEQVVARLQQSLAASATPTTWTVTTPHGSVITGRSAGGAAAAADVESAYVVLLRDHLTSGRRGSARPTGLLHTSSPRRWLGRHHTQPGQVSSIGSLWGASEALV